MNKHRQLHNCIESSSTTGGSDPITDESSSLDNPTIQSLHYLAGYIAWKLKKKGLGTFGKYTSETITENTSPTNWIQQVSRGGLLESGDCTFNAVKTCEAEFMKLFLLLKNEEGITLKMQTFITKAHPFLNPLLVKEFLNIRLKIRVKYLNEDAKNTKKNKAKAKQFLKSSAQSQKRDLPKRKRNKK
jgi:hypothetical protein